MTELLSRARRKIHRTANARRGDVELIGAMSVNIDAETIPTAIIVHTLH